MKMNKIKTALFHQSGRSMIEMLGVLAIVGVLSVGGLAGYNMAMQKIRINKLVEELNILVTDIRTLYNNVKISLKSGGSLSGIDNSALKQAAAALGGKLNDQMFGKGNYSFYINFQGLPLDACQAVASMDFEYCKFGNGTGSYYPMGSSQALAYCKETEGTTKNQMLIFDLGR
jgi:type II secretory pathway pseudopilin PulG